jgi:hypothetical protein
MTARREARLKAACACRAARYERDPEEDEEDMGSNDSSNEFSTTTAA